jgi:hypothetical protein
MIERKKKFLFNLFPEILTRNAIYFSLPVIELFREKNNYFKINFIIFWVYFTAFTILNNIHGNLNS